MYFFFEKRVSCNRVVYEGEGNKIKQIDLTSRVITVG